MQKDTYIPVFTNRPQDYREWRQRINLYRRKLELQNKIEGGRAERLDLAPRSGMATT